MAGGNPGVNHRSLASDISPTRDLRHMGGTRLISDEDHSKSIPQGSESSGRRGILKTPWPRFMRRLCIFGSCIWWAFYNVLKNISKIRPGPLLRWEKTWQGQGGNPTAIPWSTGKEGWNIKTLKVVFGAIHWEFRNSDVTVGFVTLRKILNIETIPFTHEYRSTNKKIH